MLTETLYSVLYSISLSVLGTRLHEYRKAPSTPLLIKKRPSIKAPVRWPTNYSRHINRGNQKAEMMQIQGPPKSQLILFAPQPRRIHQPRWPLDPIPEAAHNEFYIGAW